MEPDAHPTLFSRRPLVFVAIGLCLLFAVSYAGRLAERVQLRGQVAAVNARIEQAEQRRLELGAGLQSLQSRRHLDAIARDELGMGREGESVVIVADDPLPIVSSAADAAASSESVTEQPAAAMGNGAEPIWRQWVQLFAGPASP